MTKREIYDRIISLDPANSDSRFTSDDIGAALLFDAVFGGVLRFNGTSSSWWYYDATAGVWAEDKTKRAESAAEDFSKALSYYAEENGDRSFQRWAENLQRHNARRNLLLDAAPARAFTSAELDRNLDFLNTADCVVDLRDFSTRPHDPELMFALSTTARVRGDPSKTAEGRDFFEKFLAEILVDEEGKTDFDLVKYVQKIAGYALTGRNRYEKFFVCYGPSQRNAKSALLETLGEAFGSYAMATDAETIAKTKKSGREASWDLARLQGCRFLRVNEPDRELTLNSALIKVLTGQDTLLARHLYQDAIEFRPAFLMILNTNFLPSIGDSTLFSSNRLQVLPFRRHFSEEEIDVHMKDRLRRPEVLDGVLSWALDGLRAVREDGFTAPTSVVEATHQYQIEGDKVSAYVSERLRKADTFVKVGEVFEDYCTWCAVNNYAKMGKRNFLNDLRSKNLLTRDRTAGNIIEGYKIVQEKMFVDSGGVHLEVIG